MDFVLGRLISLDIKYEKVTENTIRVYGNYTGFSVVRFSDNHIEVDGRVVDEEDFEKWLYLIKQ